MSFSFRNELHSHGNSKLNFLPIQIYSSVDKALSPVARGWPPV